MSELRAQALSALDDLNNQVHQVVAAKISQMDPEVLAYIVGHYQSYLKINLADEFKKANADYHATALENLFHSG
jgi:SLT domain-containing protein